LSWMAVHSHGDPIERDLETRARVALDAAGFGWASIVFSGREGMIVGTPEDAHDTAAADALVRGLWGVRTVTARTRVYADLEGRDPKPAGAADITSRAPPPLADASGTPHPAATANAAAPPADRASALAEALRKLDLMTLPLLRPSGDARAAAPEVAGEPQPSSEASTSAPEVRAAAPH